MTPTPLQYQIALGMVGELGRGDASALLGALRGDAETFFTLTASQLASLAGRRHAFFDDGRRRELLDRAAAEAEFVRANRVGCLYMDDEAYPAMLKECPDAPVMLYALGDASVLQGRCVAFVGTRHATPYGVRWVEEAVSRLAADVPGVVVVSGLAYGIDVAAHRAALKAGVPTVAVLGHGLNTVYPAAHRQTARDIVRRGGLLLTRYTTSQPVHGGNFLARNRIIAGLSRAVVVAESAVRGGAMSTARSAFAYNREVCALPGRSTDPYSQGCNSLIADDVAHLVTDAGDIAALCGWQRKKSKATDEPDLFKADVTDRERRVLEYMRAHPGDNVNTLSAALAMPYSELSSMLTDMELRDIVAALPAGRYEVL